MTARRRRCCVVRRCCPAACVGSRAISVAATWSTCARRDGELLARGQAQYNAGESARIAGRHSRDIEAILGFRYDEAMIHRDDLVLLHQTGIGKEATA